MPDIVDPQTRSRMMSSIRWRDTKPELAVRKALRSRGIGYRLTREGLPFRPDIILAKFRAVILVHGCYWHRHGCRKTTTPASNTAFWEAKFAANIDRDKRVRAAFFSAGWRVITIWECGITTGRRDELAEELACTLPRSEVTDFEWPQMATTLGE